MKISVITVCFNCERTIENTIKSVINQDYKDVEYILIDGASTDDTLKIINKYDYKISKIISEKDVGIYDAINKGINIASGEIISLLHGNDIFFNNQVLSRAVGFFLKNKDLDVLLADVAFKRDLKDMKFSRYYPSKYFKPWMLRIGYSPPHLSSFFTKKAISINGLYDNKFDGKGCINSFYGLYVDKFDAVHGYILMVMINY